MSRITIIIPNEIYPTWNKVLNAATSHWSVKKAIFDKWDKLVFAYSRKVKLNNTFPLNKIVNIYIQGFKKKKRL